LSSGSSARAPLGPSRAPTARAGAASPGHPSLAAGGETARKARRPDRRTGRAVFVPGWEEALYPRNISSEAAVQSTMGAHQMPNSRIITEKAPSMSW
jgi:hypothetical protein